jgi:ribosome-associated protein
MHSHDNRYINETAANDDKTLALALAGLLSEHKAADVAVLDFRALSMWTDFFVIGTATSAAHLNGLNRHIKEFAALYGLAARRTNSRLNTADAGGETFVWDLTDMGSIVIHLMSAAAREFYELERLWSGAERLL